VAFPTGKADGLPVGMQLLGPPLSEERIFKALEVLEERLPDVAPDGYDTPWRS